MMIGRMMELSGKYWLVLFAMGPHNDLEGQYALVPDESGDDEAPFSNDEGCTQFHVEISIEDGYPKMQVLE